MLVKTTNLRRDRLQNQAIGQTVANLFIAGLLPNSETSEPELLSRLKLVALMDSVDTFILSIVWLYKQGEESTDSTGYIGPFPNAKPHPATT